MPPSDMDDLRAAWRALAGTGAGDGWQTISITADAPCSVLAARRKPGDEEAVLVGFRGVRPVPGSRLPQGHGFEVVRVEPDPDGEDSLVLALARRTEGSADLFAMMAEDLVLLLRRCTGMREATVLQRFLARIHAWQEFMNRHRESVLSANDEQGLFGELVVLDALIEAGLEAQVVLEAWEGPRDGVQDYVLENGAIEVKTTISVAGFPATVASLEQLDETLRQPLFVAAVRLAPHGSGMTLPEMANAVRNTLAEDREALETLEIRLMQAGLLHSTADRYTRRFRQASTTFLCVQGDFPRLTRAGVHPLIRKARYEIELDMAGAQSVTVDRALELMGVA